MFILGIRSDWFRAKAVRGLDFPQILDRRATVCAALGTSLARSLSLSLSVRYGGGVGHVEAALLEKTPGWSRIKGLGGWLGHMPLRGRSRVVSGIAALQLLV